ncbi:hypothetical protein [Tsukamurella conjunctivitidis]|nr:hypothetical protein [Tsukamurella conjunctivitidis]
MGIPELVAAMVGSVAFAELIRWITTRGKTKRELQASDIDLSERISSINKREFEYIDDKLRIVQEEAALCRRRCDRFGELTLDLLDALATHGVTEIEQYRARYRDIRDLGRSA